MELLNRLRSVASELRKHAPFTIFGALCGIAFMIAFVNLGHARSHTLFTIFHPLHVILSAIVTASLFKLHQQKHNFLLVLIVGYVGSIGIATLSDSVIPFFGESILGVTIPTHTHIHHEEIDHDHEAAHEEEPLPPIERVFRHALHIGFIEDWYIVNPAAILGILIAWFMPRTKFPHFGHVLISTWASSAHILMNTQTALTPLILLGIFIVLFLAVWIPCCISDIVFPTILSKSPPSHHKENLPKKPENADPNLSGG